MKVASRSALLTNSANKEDPPDLDPPSPPPPTIPDPEATPSDGKRASELGVRCAIVEHEVW